MKRYLIEESPFSYFFTADTRSAVLWFILRIYLGWEWLQAGWEKFQDPTWVGSNAGTALTGFIQGAIAKTGGAHPDVQSWYAGFLQSAVLPHVIPWSYLVTYGELLVGAALIVGLFVGLSAFFGMFMNFNYMLAGSVSINPIMFVIGIGLVLAWRVAGYWGLDYYVLPLLHRSIRPRTREAGVSMS